MSPPRRLQRVVEARTPPSCSPQSHRPCTANRALDGEAQVRQLRCRATTYNRLGSRVVDHSRHDSLYPHQRRLRFDSTLIRKTEFRAAKRLLNPWFAAGFRGQPTIILKGRQDPVKHHPPEVISSHDGTSGHCLRRFRDKPNTTRFKAAATCQTGDRT